MRSPTRDAANAELPNFVDLVLEPGGVVRFVTGGASRKARLMRESARLSLCVQTEYGIINLIEAYVIGAILSQLTGLPMLAAVFVAAAILTPNRSAMSATRRFCGSICWCVR